MSSPLSVPSRRIQFYIGLVVILLTIPLFGTIYSENVNWDVADFVIMAFLLGTTFLGVEIIIRKIQHQNIRILGFILVLILFLLIWAELGVGILGTPFAGS